MVVILNKQKKYKINGKIHVLKNMVDIQIKMQKFKLSLKKDHMPTRIIQLLLEKLGKFRDMNILH